MGWKAAVITIAVLLLVIAVGTFYSFAQYFGALAQRDAVQREYDSYRANVESLITDSSHFVPADDWVAKPHVVLVQKIGAAPCFDCHTPMACNDCHVEGAKSSDTGK